MIPVVMPRSGKTERMMRVSSQPWMKAFIREEKKMVIKKINMPTFSPMPSCSLLRSLSVVIEKENGECW